MPVSRHNYRDLCSDCGGDNMLAGLPNVLAQTAGNIIAGAVIKSAEGGGGGGGGTGLIGDWRNGRSSGLTANLARNPAFDPAFFGNDGAAAAAFMAEENGSNQGVNMDGTIIVYASKEKATPEGHFLRDDDFYNVAQTVERRMRENGGNPKAYADWLRESLNPQDRYLVAMKLANATPGNQNINTSDGGAFNLDTFDHIRQVARLLADGQTLDAAKTRLLDMKLDHEIRGLNGQLLITHMGRNLVNMVTGFIPGTIETGKNLAEGYIMGQAAMSAGQVLAFSNNPDVLAHAQSQMDMAHAHFSKRSQEFSDSVTALKTTITKAFHGDIKAIADIATVPAIVVATKQLPSMIMGKGKSFDGPELSLVPESYMKAGVEIDMRLAPTGSKLNAAGFPRNGAWFWRQMAKSIPEYFDADNLYQIKRDLSPIVNDTWIKQFPSHQGFRGDKLGCVDKRDSQTA